jgi:hypothetical protein
MCGQFILFLQTCDVLKRTNVVCLGANKTEVAYIKNNDPLYRIQRLLNNAHIAVLNKVTNVFLSSFAAFTNRPFSAPRVPLFKRRTNFGRKIDRHKQELTVLWTSDDGIELA